MLARHFKALAAPRIANNTARSLISSQVRLSSTTAPTVPTTAEQTPKSEITVPEHAEIVTADAVSGAPSELRHRQVRIFKPTRNTMQSGGAKTENWRIDFDILQGGGRWENPLMGWASSADVMQGTRMSFKTKEDAMHFAEKQGWEYYVQEPHKGRIPPKNYSVNYVYRPGKLRICHTK